MTDRTDHRHRIGHLWRYAFAIFFIVAVLAGCDQLTGSEEESGSEAAKITSFTASDHLVDPGSSVTLSWEVDGDAPLTLTLDPGGTDVSGQTSTTVTPTEETTYRLRAENDAGSDEVEVTVSMLAAGETVLDVSITGLPAGAAANVAVTDHGALMHWMPTGGALASIEAGTYTVAAAGVEVSGTSYLPDVGIRTFAVAEGDLVPVQVSYAAASEDLYATEPDVQHCAEGAITQEVRERGRQHLNFIRALVGLPPVDYDADDDVLVQQAALMFAANSAIDHTPPTDWHCYTEAGAEGAERSNIGITARNSTIGAVPEDFIVLWADDEGVPSLGHRRWLVDPFLADVAVGLVEGTPQAGEYSHTAGAALRIVGDHDADIADLALPFVAYPRGDFPTDLFTNDWFLSFSVIADPSGRFNNRTQVDYGGATIRVEDASGTTLTVTDVAADHATSGMPNQLKWRVVGLEDDEDYTVTIGDVVVNGTARTFSYSIHLQ